MSAADKAHEEMLEKIPEKQLVEELGVCLARTRLWYRLHGRTAVSKSVTQFMEDFRKALFVGTVADDDPRVLPN